MKLIHVHMASRAVTERAHLISQRDHETIGVTITGKYQDEDMLAAVRPAVRAELDRRIAQVERDLEAWGVELD